MRCMPVLTLISLAMASAAPANAGKDPFAFFADGASAVEVEGSGQVPLMRGVDTQGRPAFLAQGPDKEDPDEFLLSLRMAVGPNSCTEGVVKALGGEIDEYTLGRVSKGLFKSATKIVTKGATIPELRIKGEDGSQVIIRDWHCEIHAEDNALSILSLDESAVALLADKGVVEFAPAAKADALLKKVGEPVQGTRSAGGFVLDEGRASAEVGSALVVDGQIFGQSARMIVQTNRSSRVTADMVELPFVARHGNDMYTSGDVSLGGVTLAERASFLVYDMPIETTLAEDPSNDIIVSVGVGLDVLHDVSIAIDPSTNRLAVARVQEASWTDPGEKLVQDAKDTFDEKGGDDASATLLQPLGDDVRLAAVADPVCVPELKVTDRSFQTRDGVRAFGVAALDAQEVPCVEQAEVKKIDRFGYPVLEQSLQDESESGTADAPEGGSAGSSDGEADPKEASRLADYADALWKHGRYEEALDLYDQAKDLAGQDCSYHHDFALKALVMGRTDDALESARTAAEIYEPWAAQSLETRLDVQAGRTQGAAITEPQPHVCHTARGIQANASLAKGSHRQVEELYEQHMDLDESLASALAISRLQRGQVRLARGPALQALDVGGRGNPLVHAVHGAVASRMGSERLLLANLDRLHESEGIDSSLALVGVGMASTQGPDTVKSFTERLVKERPQVPAAWVAHGIEAQRRGDAAAQAQVVEVSDDVARDWVELNAGSGSAWCEAASLLAVAGKLDKADTYRENAKGRPGASTDCLTYTLVRAVVTSDAQGTANALQELARRAPPHPLGTLSMIQALPAPAATDKDEAGEQE